MGRRFIPSAMRERHTESGSIDVSARINAEQIGLEVGRGFLGAGALERAEDAEAGVGSSAVARPMPEEVPVMMAVRAIEAASSGAWRLRGCLPATAHPAPRLEVRPHKREGGSGERIAERDRFERHVTAVVGCPRLVRPRVERDARCDGPWGHGNTGAGGRGKAAAP